MSEEVEFLKERVRVLEETNVELWKQWELMLGSLIEVWRSLMDLSGNDEAPDPFGQVFETADEQIERLEKLSTKVDKEV